MADTVEKSLEFAVRKTDDAAQMVYGWANVAALPNGEPLIDLQGDLIPLPILEEAMYEYAKSSRGLNFMHEGPVRGQLVEMLMFTPEKIAMLGLPAESVPLGAFVSYHIPDAADYRLAKVQKYFAFSIEGTCEREAME